MLSLQCAVPRNEPRSRAEGTNPINRLRVSGSAWWEEGKRKCALPCLPSQSPIPSSHHTSQTHPHTHTHAYTTHCSTSDTAKDGPNSLSLGADGDGCFLLAARQLRWEGGAYADSEDGALPGAGRPHAFHTLPAYDTSASLRLWAVGDSGTGTTEQDRVRDAFYRLEQQEARAADVFLALGGKVVSLDGRVGSNRRRSDHEFRHVYRLPWTMTLDGCSVVPLARRLLVQTMPTRRERSGSTSSSSSQSTTPACGVCRCFPSTATTTR